MENEYRFLIDEVLSKYGEEVNTLSKAKKLSKEISNINNGKAILICPIGSYKL